MWIAIGIVPATGTPSTKRHSICISELHQSIESSFAAILFIYFGISEKPTQERESDDLLGPLLRFSGSAPTTSST